MSDDQIDYKDIRLGGGAPASLELSVIMTLAGAGLVIIGFPLLAFGGGVYIFGLLLTLFGLLAFLYGAFKGGFIIIAGYINDFKKHWRPQYKKPAIIGALIGLFFSLLYLPAAPVLMIVGAATAVHLARKAEGDTAFPAFPAEDSDTQQTRRTHG